MRKYVFLHVPFAILCLTSQIARDFNTGISSSPFYKINTSTNVNAARISYAFTDNIAPSVTTNSDQTITLPTNVVNLTSSATDIDGTIAQLRWTKLSAPGQAIKRIGVIG